MMWHRVLFYFVVAVFIAYISYNEYRLRDYEHVSQDAVCSAHPGQFGCPPRK